MTPRATYRLQLRPGFGFDEVAEVAPYLAELGISHVYLSPYLQAAPGSQHGYDVVDHNRVNEELGGPEAHARMCRSLAKHGLSQLIDVVSNHMSIASEQNLWWADVLENGPFSQFGEFFDVDWNLPDERQKNKVLLPILSDHHGRVLEAGGIEIVRRGGTFFVKAGGRTLPAAPQSVDTILARAAAITGSDVLDFLARACRALPDASETNPSSVARRSRGKQLIASELERLLTGAPGLAEGVDRAVAELNRDCEALDAFLDRQNYRLEYWRDARQDLNYRRFFDVNELVALCMDLRPVFEATHRLVIGWVKDGTVEGLRIDHVDGLRDPDHYLEWLRDEAPSAYIVVEKICAMDELVPSRFSIDGTTGYEFLAFVSGLFVDPRGEQSLDELYERITGEALTPFAELAHEKKRLVLRTSLASDLSRLVRILRRICERHRGCHDYTPQELRAALEAMLVGLPVYRTYLREGGAATDRDAELVRAAADYVRNALPDADPGLVAFVQELLTGQHPGDLENELVARFQQLSGPVMAKGVEDTAFYCDRRLVCLDEVGGDPSRFGVSVEEFHRFCRALQAAWPATLLATSTHDTKLSEDARLRVALIASHPERWAHDVERWFEMAARHRTGDLPEAAMEYVLFQALVGAFPIDADRLSRHALKSAREAKLYTSWTDPRHDYEQALTAFARAIATDADLMSDVASFVLSLEPELTTHSLSQTLLKLTAPGVPDIYQGNELSVFALTDPDNRRPVDFERRRALLALGGRASAEGGGSLAERAPKLFVIRRALDLRKRRPESFGRTATYEPLGVTGRHRESVVAFGRSAAVVTIAPRLVGRVAGDWADTAVELPRGRFRNVFTDQRVQGGSLELSSALSGFPVALFERETE